MKKIIWSFVLVVCLGGPAGAAEPDAGLRFYNAALKQYSAAPGIASEIHVDVNGTIARTQVIQYFANDTDAWQEGLYTWPLPDDAAVDKQVMVIGERRIVGFVAQREKARKIYEQAKRDGRATSLVEQHRDNMFRTQVANIPPHSLIAIEIGYQSDVAIDGMDFSLRLPLAITPRYDHFSPEDFITTVAGSGQNSAARDLTERLALFDFSGGQNPVALTVRLDAGFKTGALDSPSHKINVKGGEDGAKIITTAQPIAPGQKDFVLHWEPRDMKQPLSFLHSDTIDQQVYSQLVVVPPKDVSDFTGQTQRKRQVTLIIDVSGSMAGPSLRQAKAALIEAIEDLTPDDLFNVISFESLTRSLYSEVQTADDAHKKDALKWVAALEAGGGTEMRPAIERALGERQRKGYLRQVVFITDGAIGYEAQLAAYIKDHVGDARFYAVGIGAAPNAHLMRLIAMSGRGTFTFIGHAKETGKKMGVLFKKMKRPVLSDLKLVVPDDIRAEIIPAKIPDLMAGDPVSLAVKSDKPLHDLTLSGLRGDKSWTQPVKAPRKTQAAGIDKIYARRKIQALEFADPAGSNPDTEKQITALAIDHQIMSEYTSLVAVDEKILRPKGAVLAAKRYDPSLPEGWQLADYDPRAAARAYDEVLQDREKSDKSQNLPNHDMNLPQTASNWMIRLAGAMLLLLTALGLYMQEGRDDIQVAA